MGLNFKQSNAQWSYSGFMSFRERLASEIGLTLREMDGFKDGGNSWDSITDAIKPFLNHSDCDGELSVDEMKLVAPRLRELVADWEDDHDKENALELASDMEALILSGKPLIFT